MKYLFYEMETKEMHPFFLVGHMILSVCVDFYKVLCQARENRLTFNCK